MRTWIMAAMLLVLFGAAGCAPPVPPRFATPTDDGDVCHTAERVVFYQQLNATDQAIRAQQAGGGTQGQDWFAGALEDILPRLLDQGLPVVGMPPGMAPLARDVITKLARNMAQVTRQAQDDQVQIARLTQRFDALVACRRAEEAGLRARMNNSRLPRAERDAARAEYRLLRDRMQTDVNAARDVNRNFSARNATFILATNEARQQARQGGNISQSDQAEIVQASSVVQTNQRALRQQEDRIAGSMTGWQNVGLPGPLQWA